jgi:uncharacterized repeat protein (TIGR03803 family)
LKDLDYWNGAYPHGTLLQASNGKLYGITSGGQSGTGVIYSFDPISSTYSKLYEFDNYSGANGMSGLIQASDGKLYGMTPNGGLVDVQTNIFGFGVIFSFDPASAIFTKLKDFNGSDGSHPGGSLLQLGDGKLYGMTSQGGTIDNSGVIFSYDPLKGNLYRFEEF